MKSIERPCELPDIVVVRISMLNIFMMVRFDLNLHDGIPENAMANYLYIYVSALQSHDEHFPSLSLQERETLDGGILNSKSLMAKAE